MGGGAEEMAQQESGALAALAEDWVSAPRRHVGQLTVACNASAKRPLLASAGTAHKWCTYIYEVLNTYIHYKTKISKSLVKRDRGQGLV